MYNSTIINMDKAQRGFQLILNNTRNSDRQQTSYCS